MTGELMFYANNICLVPGVWRQDTCELKRVELHLHTRMSTQDGITEVGAAFETAKRFGHKALAITDHGVVQAFPAAAKAAKKTGVKPIFGVEGYLLRESELIDLEQSYVVFDLETTGLKPEQCEIIEVGAVKLKDGANRRPFPNIRQRRRGDSREHHGAHGVSRPTCCWVLPTRERC